MFLDTWIDSLEGTILVETLVLASVIDFWFLVLACCLAKYVSSLFAMTIDDGVLDANEDVGDLVNDLELELELGLEWAGFLAFSSSLDCRAWSFSALIPNNFNTTKYCINLFFTCSNP